LDRHGEERSAAAIRNAHGSPRRYPPRDDEYNVAPRIHPLVCSGLKGVNEGFSAQINRRMRTTFSRQDGLHIFAKFLKFFRALP
jgi:hypothetical protein